MVLEVLLSLLGPHVFFLLSSLRGNALRQASAWRGTRVPLLLLLLGAVCVGGLGTWFYITLADREITETLVRWKEQVSPLPRVYNVPCSADYENYKRYPGEFASPRFNRWRILVEYVTKMKQRFCYS